MYKIILFFSFAVFGFDCGVVYYIYNGNIYPNTRVRYMIPKPPSNFNPLLFENTDTSTVVSTVSIKPTTNIYTTYSAESTAVSSGSSAHESTTNECAKSCDNRCVLPQYRCEDNYDCPPCYICDTDKYYIYKICKHVSMYTTTTVAINFSTTTEAEIMVDTKFTTEIISSEKEETEKFTSTNLEDTTIKEITTEKIASSDSNDESSGDYSDSDDFLSTKEISTIKATPHLIKTNSPFISTTDDFSFSDTSSITNSPRDLVNTTVNTVTLSTTYDSTQGSETTDAATMSEGSGNDNGDEEDDQENYTTEQNIRSTVKTTTSNEIIISENSDLNTDNEEDDFTTAKIVQSTVKIATSSATTIKDDSGHYSDEEDDQKYSITTKNVQSTVLTTSAATTIIDGSGSHSDDDDDDDDEKDDQKNYTTEQNIRSTVKTTTSNEIIITEDSGFNTNNEDDFTTAKIVQSTVKIATSSATTITDDRDHHSDDEEDDQKYSITTKNVQSTVLTTSATTIFDGSGSHSDDDDDDDDDEKDDQEFSVTTRILSSTVKVTSDENDIIEENKEEYSSTATDITTYAETAATEGSGFHEHDDDDDDDDDDGGQEFYTTLRNVRSTVTISDESTIITDSNNHNNSTTTENLHSTIKSTSDFYKTTSTDGSGYHTNIEKDDEKYTAISNIRSTIKVTTSDRTIITESSGYTDDKEDEYLITAKNIFSTVEFTTARLKDLNVTKEVTNPINEEDNSNISSTMTENTNEYSSKLFTTSGLSSADLVNNRTTVEDNISVIYLPTTSVTPQEVGGTGNALTSAYQKETTTASEGTNKIYTTDVTNTSEITIITSITGNTKESTSRPLFTSSLSLEPNFNTNVKTTIDEMRSTPTSHVDLTTDTSLTNDEVFSGMGSRDDESESDVDSEVTQETVSSVDILKLTSTGETILSESSHMTATSDFSFVVNKTVTNSIPEDGEKTLSSTASTDLPKSTTIQDNLSISYLPTTIGTAKTGMASLDVKDITFSGLSETTSYSTVSSESPHYSENADSKNVTTDSPITFKTDSDFSGDDSITTDDNDDYDGNGSGSGERVLPE